MGRISPNYFVQDGVIPRTKLPEVLERIDGARDGVRADRRQRLPRRRRQPAPAGLLRRRASRARPSAPRSCPGRILDACLEAGGSITGEHGVGVDKKQHMPKMFGEADLDAFQRLRCAFDPAGLANPGKVMPTPRLCGEVPGPVPPAPARGGGPGGAVLMTVEEAAAEIRELAAPSARRAAAARSSAGARGERRAGASTRGGLNRILEHNVGRLHRRARGRRAARGGAGGVRAPTGQMLALDPPLGAGDAATDRRHDRHQRLRPAAPPLRRRARPRGRHHRRALRRHDRQVGRQGDQERRRLRPRASCSPARSARSG